MKRKISIYNNDIKDNPQKREELRRKLIDQGFDTGRDGDVLIVLGGDGTFLTALEKKINTETLIVGINTGNLGFYSEFEYEDIDYILSLLKREAYDIQEIPVYEVILGGPKRRSEYFLNEVAIKEHDSLIHLNIDVNDERFCSVHGDGVIVSSGTGSTGYAVPSGGSIMVGLGDALQLTPLSPQHTKRYQSLTHSVVFGGDHTLTIYPNAVKIRKYRVVCDGNRIDHQGTKYIEIRKTPHTLKLIRSPKFNELQNIKHKILGKE